MNSATLLALRIPAFEAAIRKAANPGLARRPVVVATSFKTLGRVVSACPMAHAAGIDPDMPYPTARTLCPEAAFFVPDQDLAAQMRDELLKRSQAYSPLVEPAGSGCVLLDTRGTERLWGDSRHVAELLQADIRARLRLPAAAGLSTRRPWSLLASRAAGDAGLCHIAPGDEDGFLEHTPVVWIDGITPRTRARLLEMNIRTAGQLRQFGREHILRQFGRSCGEILWEVIHPEPWSISAAATRKAATDNDDAIRTEAALAEAAVAEETLRLVVRDLAGRIAADLRRRDQGAARLRMTLLHADGAFKTAEARTGGFVQDERLLTETAMALLKQVFARRVRATRLWLAAEKLAAPERQSLLFPDPSPVAIPTRQTEKLLSAMDGIRKRYGETSVQAAAMLHPANSPRKGRFLPGTGRRKVS